jgi:hypothetical protein
MTDQLQAMAQIPGALDMLMTTAAEELGGPKGGKTKQIRMYNLGGAVQSYDQGGLGQIMAQQSPEVRADMSTGEDEMLLNVSPDEYDAITSMWGPPEMGADGIPSYGFLSKLWKGIKKTVKKIVKSPLFSFLAPIALNIFVPGLGSALGGMLGATGQAAATIGNTVLRTGIGALSGGKEGAISGLVSGLTAGGVGKGIGTKLGLKGATARIAGDALIGGTGSKLAGGEFGAGALGQATTSLMGDPMRAMEEKLTGAGREFFKRPPVDEFGQPLAAQAAQETGFGGVDPLTGDLMQPTAADFGPTRADIPFGDPGSAQMGPPAPPGAPVGPQQPAGGGAGNIFGTAVDWMKENPWKTAAGGLGLAYMMSKSGGETAEGPGALPPRFEEGLPQLSFDRQQQSPDIDYFTYGQAGAQQEGEAQFFDPNALPQGQGTGNTALDIGAQGQALPGLGGPMGAAGMPGGRGGGGARRAALQQQGWTFDPATNMMYPPVGQQGNPVPAALGGLIAKYQEGGHVRGPGSGRSDDIPAVLSDGEYVIDSESVALLGDGSTDAGAERLDKMRENLRKHKGKNLAKGGFSHKAKEPARYMQEGGYVPPKDNPHKRGTARYKMWERKYGKKKLPKEPPKKPGKKDDDEAMVAKVERYKSRSEKEMEKLGLKEGGEVRSGSAMKDLKRLATKLETAITSGNKKRVREISAQLRSLDGGDKVIQGMRKGGTAKGIKKRASNDALRDLKKMLGAQATDRELKSLTRAGLKKLLRTTLGAQMTEKEMKMIKSKLKEGS